MLTKDVIKFHRARLKLTEQQLGDRIGVSRSSIQQWEKGRTAPKRANHEAVAEALGISVGELLGVDAPSITASRVRMSLAAGESPMSFVDDNSVPMLSWGCSDPTAFDASKDAEVWLPCPAKHGPQTYCMKVTGDSMFNPAGRPSYADGDVIFVDPDRRPEPGDRVIVRVPGQTQSSFKQLVSEDGRNVLKALNPEWKPRYMELPADAAIIGVVIGTWIPE